MYSLWKSTSLYENRVELVDPAESPILPHRLYLLHITLLVLPIFMFLTYAINFQEKSQREEDEIQNYEVR